jgi:hypothetical protein
MLGTLTRQHLGLQVAVLEGRIAALPNQRSRIVPGGASPISAR